MKLDWNPDRVAFIDFETQSACPLTTVHKYATHPSTRVLTCVVKADGKVHRLGPYLDGEAKLLLHAIAQDHVLVAHNAPFDAAVWEHAAHLPPAVWYDTLPCCRAAAYPGKLDDVGTLLTGSGKDPMGEKLIRMLCILKPGQVPPVAGPAHDLLLDYNVRDVDLLETVYTATLDFGEADVMTADRTVNDRGIPIDRKFMEWLLDCFEQNSKLAGEKFHQQTDGVLPSSPKQVVAWLRGMGFAVDGINKFTYKNLMADPEKFFDGDGDMDAAFSVVKEALEQRREVVRVGKGKAEAAAECLESDDRIREQLVYWGAHPGRWSGRKLQVHNLPHAPKDIDLHALAYAPFSKVCDAVQPGVCVSDILNGMLRHMVRSGSLIYADYGAVELRGTAWVAGCDRMLDLLSDPKQSIYLDMGEKLFGRRISKEDYGPYMFSKALVLGSTYGMSGGKFEWMCKMRNVKVSTLQEAGVNPREAVKVFRSTYVEIPAVWRAFHDAVHSAVAGVPMEAGRCAFFMDGPHLTAVLPSSRRIMYRNARVEPRVPGYCLLYGMPSVTVPTVTFDLPRMRSDGTCSRGFLYGSRICENMVQALCRDLLADSLVKAEQAGLHPILHVHDELCCEDPPDKLPLLLEIMSTGPAWAAGFPLLVEGCAGPVWTKQTKSYIKQDALCGRMLPGKAP